MNIRPFRSNRLFRGHGSFHQNACVGNNGGPYDLYDYAHGYFAATEALLTLSESSTAVVDTLVYPICFNFRHSVELYLKYLVTTLSEIDDVRREKNGHKLPGLWEEAQKLAKKVDFELGNDRVELFSEIILCIVEVDPEGQIFRYPQSIKGIQHLSEWSLINIDVLRAHIEATFASFRELHFQIEGTLAYTRDMRAEMAATAPDWY